MGLLQSWDARLFRWVNRDCAQPWLDPVMRFFSVNPYFTPVLVVGLLLLAWRGGARGRICVLLLGLALAVANAAVVNPVKSLAARPRPYVALDDVVLRVGRGNPVGSLPSAHALNCALMAAVVGWYYRRSLWATVPVAVTVGVSRVYNGVHFPTDVIAGMALGVATAGATLWGADRLWRWRVRAWMPGRGGQVVSLLNPGAVREPADVDAKPGAGR